MVDYSHIDKALTIDGTYLRESIMEKFLDKVKEASDEEKQEEAWKDTLFQEAVTEFMSEQSDFIIENLDKAMEIEADDCL